MSLGFSSRVLEPIFAVLVAVEDMLRIQTHEYSNKLHTISGLIQIGAYQEAIELIGSETPATRTLSIL